MQTFRVSVFITIVLISMLSMKMVLAQNSTGINTTSPSPRAALDVQTDGNNKQGILVPRLSHEDTTTIKTLGIPSSSKGLLFYDTINTVYHYWNGSRWLSFGGSTASSLWAQDGSGIYNVNAGNVGIGINNPLASLHIVQSSSPFIATLRLQSTAGFSPARVEFYSDPVASASEWRPGYIESTDNGVFTGGIRFVTNGSGSTQILGEIEAMRIVNGNVGVGITSPTSRLQVAGSGTASAYVGNAGCSGDFAGIGLHGPFASCTNYSFLGDAVNLYINRPAGGSMLFRYNNDDQMTLTAAGDLGIGTTSPTQKLHVNTTSQIAVYGFNSSTTVANNSAGVLGQRYVTGSECDYSYGVYGYLSGDQTNLGTGRRAGVYGECTGTGYINAAIFGRSGTGASFNYGVFSVGDCYVQGTLAKTAGTFKIDHPLDPENKYLYHSFVESPDMLNIYNGNVMTDSKGIAIVKLPDYFEALNIDYRYQLTVIGTYSQVYISKKIQNGTFSIQSDKPNVEISWQVTGVRNDPYAAQNRVKVEVEKHDHEKGTYLHPEVYGKTEEKATNYYWGKNVKDQHDNSQSMGPSF